MDEAFVCDVAGASCHITVCWIGEVWRRGFVRDGWRLIRDERAMTRFLLVKITASDDLANDGGQIFR